MPLEEDDKWTLERWTREKQAKDDAANFAARAQEEAATAEAVRAAREAARAEALAGTASFAEDAINAAERATGLDLDGDGDIGERGARPPAGNSEQDRASESVDAAPQQGVAGFFEGMSTYAEQAINAVEAATGLDLDGDGDVGGRGGPVLPGLYWKEIFSRSADSRELSNARLSEALCHKQNFTQREIDGFNVEGLDWKTWIRAPATDPCRWFMPATEPEDASKDEAQSAAAEEPKLETEIEIALAKAAAEVEAANAVVLRWIKLDHQPWGRRVVSNRLSKALENGTCQFTMGTMKEFGIYNLDEDFCFVEARGAFYEPLIDGGTMMCPLCRSAWLTVEPTGDISRSPIIGEKKQSCPCSEGLPRLDLVDQERKVALDLLKELMETIRQQGGLARRRDRSSRETVSSRASREDISVTDLTLTAAQKSARRRAKRASTRHQSARGGFTRTSHAALLPAPSGTPRSLIRNAVTEAVFRRFEVEFSNLALGEEERLDHHMRSEGLKYATEQHRQYGASVVAEGKEQVERLGTARKSVFDAHDAQGSAVVQQVAAIKEELAERRVLYSQHAKRVVGDTKSMQQRAKQNVQGVKESNRKQGNEGKADVLSWEKVRDDSRQMHFEEKRTRAHRVRQSTSPAVLANSAAIWAETRAQAGSTLRAINSEGRLARENERLGHLQGAVAFKAETRAWQANARALRSQIEEDRRARAHAERERRERDEDKCRQAALQDMIERKEAHDAIAEARHADEELVAGYLEYQHSLLAVSRSHVEARRVAAKRATALRRQGRRHERSLFRGMLLQLQSRPNGSVAESMVSI